MGTKKLTKILRAILLQNSRHCNTQNTSSTQFQFQDLPQLSFHLNRLRSLQIQYFVNIIERLRFYQHVKPPQLYPILWGID